MLFTVVYFSGFLFFVTFLCFWLTFVQNTPYKFIVYVKHQGDLLDF